MAYIAAIDPILFKHDSLNRVYGPKLFDSTSSSDPCNSSGSYLNGFFRCAELIAQTTATDLTLEILKGALSEAFPRNYIKLNLSEVFNPTYAALHYYDLANNTVSIQHLMERGLFYPLESVLPYSNCRYIDFDKISPNFSNEESINDAFENYKNYFLNKIAEANGNKNQIKASIILFISQIEGTHFFNNGNNRLSCQILLNKLLVEYGVYDDKLGSILFIPNGFSHYALSYLNYYLKDNHKTLDTCTIQDLEIALEPAVAWLDFGHECYKTVVEKRVTHQGK